jgi:DNA repair protein RecN (Recombination protein N)
LTGETGAGKSIILGALSLALGGKANKESLRYENEEALVEAIFSVEDESIKERLREINVECFDDEVILTRKVSATRAKAMINGESVPSQKLAQVGAYLIDIYGQHEHQTLLRKEKHLEIIDEYGGAELSKVKANVASIFEELSRVNRELSEAESANNSREKDLMFLHHEVEEIENALLKAGEDEELENEYSKMKNSQKIMESVGEAYQRTSDDGASALLGGAINAISRAMEYDSSLSDAYSILSDADSLLNDFNRTISDYISDASFDAEYFNEVERRLDLINNLKSKYGNTIEDILSTLEEKQNEIEKIENFDGYLEGLRASRDRLSTEYLEAASTLTALREKSRDRLLSDVRVALLDLNFSNTEIEMPFEKS